MGQIGKFLIWYNMICTYLRVPGLVIDGDADKHQDQDKNKNQ